MAAIDTLKTKLGSIQTKVTAFKTETDNVITVANGIADEILAAVPNISGGGK